MNFAKFFLPEWLEPHRRLILDGKYVIITIVIIVSLSVVAKILRRLLKRYFEKENHYGSKDQTNYLFLKNAVNFVVFILGLFLIFYTIPSLRALGITLFASAGIFAAVLGFASQQAFSNIIGGIFIVIFKPFRVQDIIQVGDSIWGLVEDITIRHTVIRSFENRRYIIPNSTMSSETILNSSIEDSRVCIFLEMGISYDSDVEKAFQIMQEEGLKHKYFIDHRTEEEIAEGLPPINCRIIGFGDSSVNLRAYIWAPDPLKGFDLKTDLYLAVKKRFDAEGIEIPFPYRTIVYKNEKKDTRKDS